MDLDPERGERGDDAEQRPAHPGAALRPDRGEHRDEERDRLGRDERDELADDSLLRVGGIGDAARARATLGDGVLLQRADGRKGNQAHVASFGTDGSAIICP